MISLSFERHSCPIYIPLVWKLLELSWLFYKILEKNDRTLLTTQYIVCNKEELHALDTPHIDDVVIVISLGYNSMRQNL